MEEIARFGALIVSGGVSSALPVPSEQLVLAQNTGNPAPEFTTLDRQASDALFANPLPTQEPSLAAAALVVAAGTLSLKAVVVDESGIFDEREEEEAEPRRRPRSDNDDSTTAG
jgi:hypothetical protein